MPGLYDPSRQPGLIDLDALYQQGLLGGNRLMPPPVSPASPAPFQQGARALPGVAAEALGLPDALKAWRGQMSEPEAQDFFMGAAMGLLPMRKGIQAATTAAKGIRAYHVSPHDFDKFDMSKINTGQGAQSFGHGLYFAENPNVSGGQNSQYWRDFASSHFKGRHDAQGLATNALMQANGDREAAIKFLYDPKYTPNPPQEFADAVKLLKSDKPVGPVNYEVNINARPEQFLDWDKPLSSPKQGLDAIFGRKLFGKTDDLGLSVPARENAVRLFTKTQEGTDILRDVGIPGIRYLDQGSRVSPPYLAGLESSLATAKNDLAKAMASGAPDIRIKQIENGIRSLEQDIAKEPRNQTSNYVVFDDKLIDILRKYGLVGMPAGYGLLSGADDRQ